MPVQRRRWFILCLAAVVLAAGTALAQTETPSGPPCVPPPALALQWQPLFKGIDATSASIETPPLAVYAVRIDLKTPGISFLTTPPNGDKPQETDGQKVSEFLAQYKTQVAINATPFSPVDEIAGGPRNIGGVSISRGETYSRPAKVYAALLISKDNRVWFSKPPLDTKDAYNAVGGYRMILERGENTGASGVRHPRSVAGLSQDGRYLYLMVIDGRQEDYSVGATEHEASAWARALGAFDALNLDGGGSTALVVDDGAGGVRALNRPIHKGIPGNERINGNNLGVFAEPLAQ